MARASFDTSSRHKADPWNSSCDAWSGYYAGMALGGFAPGATLVSLPSMYAKLFRSPAALQPIYSAGGVTYRIVMNPTAS